MFPSHRSNDENINVPAGGLSAETSNVVLKLLIRFDADPKLSFFLSVLV